MKVLSFDLGETTGYCLLVRRGDDWSVKSHGVFTRLSFVSTVAGLSRENPQLVVIERTAFGEYQDQRQRDIGQIYLALTAVFPETHTIRPVDWKATQFRNLSAAVLGKCTPHEKDAYRIAVYSTERILPNVRP
jgi:hypothetical protein